MNNSFSEMCLCPEKKTLLTFSYRPSPPLRSLFRLFRSHNRRKNESPKKYRWREKKSANRRQPKKFGGLPRRERFGEQKQQLLQQQQQLLQQQQQEQRLSQVSRQSINFNTCGKLGSSCSSAVERESHS